MREVGLRLFPGAPWSFAERFAASLVSPRQGPLSSPASDDGRRLMPGKQCGRRRGGACRRERNFLKFTRVSRLRLARYTAPVGCGRPTPHTRGLANGDDERPNYYLLTYL